MKDFFGQEINVGDSVAFMQPDYRNLMMGVVAAFTPKKVKIYWNNPIYPTCPKPYVGPDGTRWLDSFLTPPETIIVKK